MLIYLIINSRGVDRMVKSDKHTLAHGEKVVAVEVTIDRAIFTPPPRLTARLEVTGHNILGSGVVTLDPTEPDVKHGNGQDAVNNVAAKLLQMAINSGDEDLRSLALESLSTVKAHGVEVKIVMPEEA